MREDQMGASTGGARENNSQAAGFTETDRLFRSHFQHANHLADRGYEAVQGAYGLGFGAASLATRQGHRFEDVEQELENGWLRVRTAAGDWASVREFAAEGFRVGSQSTEEAGRLDTNPPADDDNLPPFADPLADDSRL
jgi:hypothetical protein